MMNVRPVTTMILASVLACGVFAQDADDADGKQLDELLARVTQARTPAEADVRRVLEMALSQGRPHGALPVCKTYLAQNPNPPAALLKLIAENTRLSGDYRLASTRQNRLVLALPKGSEEASVEAAVLYRMMIRDTGSERDAYAFMTVNGTSLRSSLAAKKYDEWYLEAAWKNNDVPAVAKWLASCFSDQAPLEQERMLFWDDLDRLIEATRLDNPDVYRGLEDMRKLAGLIREDPVRAARLKFQAETLAFNAAAPGKDADALEKLLPPVAAAARAWVDAAPSGATLRSICEMWADDFRHDGGVKAWQRGEKGKQAFFKERFAKLSDAERVVVAQRCGICLTPADWLELVEASSPGPERNRWVGAVPFEANLKNRAAYKALAAKLAGVGGGSAVVIRSMAAGDDYFGCLKHLYEKESSFLGDLRELTSLENRLLGMYRALPVEERKDENAYETASQRGFAEVQLSSGLLVVMLPHTVKDELLSVWRSGGHSLFVQSLELLRSVPWSKADREMVLSRSQEAFRQWSDNVRRQEAAARNDPERKAQWDADVAKMAALDAAFRVALDEKSFDASKAPTPLAGLLAELMLAERRKDNAAALAAGRKAYAMVRDFGEKNLPFATIFFREVVKGRRNVDMLDLQCEALADQLARRVAQQSSSHDTVLWSIIDAQGGLPGNDWRRLQNKAALAKVEAAVGKATLAMLEAGAFDATVFDLYRQMVSDNETSRKVFARLVEDKVLVKHKEYLVVRPGPNGEIMPLDRCYNAATKYQWLLAREFAGMSETYPRDSYFDDMFVAEVARTGLADPLFWRYSRDEARKGANAAAVALKACAASLPFGYDGATPVYTREAYADVLGHVLRHADPGPRNELIAAAEAAFGKTRYDDLAIGRVRIDFLATEAPDARKQWFEQVDAFLDRAAKAPRETPMPAIPPFLQDVKNADALTAGELATLVRMFRIGRPPIGDGDTGPAFIEVFKRGLEAHGRTVGWLSLAPEMWNSALTMDDSSRRRVYGLLVKYAEAFAEDGQMNIAGTLSTSAIAMGIPIDRRPLEVVRAKALAALGNVIPVDEDDPRYPLYEAQMGYMAGSEARAWASYSSLSNAVALVRSEVGKLDPLFLVWVADKASKQGEHSTAEALVGIILNGVESKAVPLPDAESRARLDLLLADIDLARERYDRAAEGYRRVAEAEEYATTRARIDAVIGMSEVLRRSEKYDQATGLLEDMLRGNRDRYARSHGALQLAKVKLAEGALSDAAKFLDEALQYSADLPDAKLLEGEVNLARRKLQEASEVEISDATRLQNVLIPGKPLSIEIEDPNLSVVGGNVAIEVRVWTEKGDEETLTILPFGDSKSTFRGWLSTALGKPVKEDQVLQVLGGDTVRYDYSPRFKKNNAMRDTSWDVPELSIRSDSRMAAASGSMGMEDEGANLRIRALAAGPGGDVSKKPSISSVKPGNAIRVRVIDADRSMTVSKDAVVVTATASSGDSVRLTVPETEDVSGVFEAALRTAVAPVMATASDSVEGSDPLFAVSGGDHEPWVAAPGGKETKTYAVDMNDNVELKTMSILADVPARGLKSFLVQTSMDGVDFQTVGSWPKAATPWDGSLRMTVLSCPVVAGIAERNRNDLQALAAIRRFMAGEGAAAGKQQQLPAKLSMAGPDSGVLDAAGVARHASLGNPWYVVHVQGAFFLPARAERTFRSVVNGAAGILLIDGMPAKWNQVSGKTELVASLEKGVHTLDFYLWPTPSGSPQWSYDIQWDIAEAPYFATCSEEAFDIRTHPQIEATMKFVPATVEARSGNTAFDVSFTEGMRARVIRLVLADFEGDAPALRKLTLHDLQNRRLLPTKMDLSEIRKNDILEIKPGDDIRITYEDPTPVTESETIQTAELSAAYANASVQMCYIGRRQANPDAPVLDTVPIWRFRPGKWIYVVISDVDEDVSDQPDMVRFRVRTSSGAEVELDAVEGRLANKPAADSDGVDAVAGGGRFIGRFLPVEREPQAKNEVRLLPNDDLTVVYMDKENTSPGIPWLRTAECERAPSEGTPEVYVYDLTSAYLPESDQVLTNAPGAVVWNRAADDGSGEVAKSPESGMAGGLADEFVPTRRVIMGHRRELPTDACTATGMVTVSVPVEVVWPAMLLSQASRVHVFAQSYESRRLAGVTNQNEFSIDMPGTIALSAVPGVPLIDTLPPGYDSVSLRRSSAGADRGAGQGELTTMGVFGSAVPLQLGEPSTMTREDRDAIMKERAARMEDGEHALAVDELRLGVLPVRGANDGVVIGIPYTSDAIAYENGDLGTNMIVRHVALHSDPFLDIMDLQYNQLVDSLYMGETVYLRVIDPAGDVSGDKDSVTVQVTVGEGDPVVLPLMETYPHSGVFKGLLEMATVGEAAESSRIGVVGADYGKNVMVAYAGGVPGERLERTFTIDLGSAGAVRGFTRHFKDPAIAMKTQFTVAESCFKLARSHRSAGMAEEADKVLAQGRKLLEEAIRDYPESEARAQAEYLLAELALESGDAADDEEAAKGYQADALQRFSDIVSSFPDSEYAPKAQFNKALMLEKLGQIDQACEEYVKLSYKYPGNPLIAETIARLGGYFVTKSKETKELLAAEADELKRNRLERRLNQEYVTAAEVFGRLSERFPDHRLAAVTLVRSGQCFMQAMEFDRSSKQFLSVINGGHADKDLVAEAMYWCGDAYAKAGEQALKGGMPASTMLAAFRMWKRLTWDYPESKWAKYARARLGDGAFVGAVRALQREE